MKYSQIVVNFPVVSGLNVVKTLKNALLFTTMPVGFLTASPRVTFDDGAVVVVIVGLK